MINDCTAVLLWFVSGFVVSFTGAKCFCGERCRHRWMNGAEMKELYRHLGQFCELPFNLFDEHRNLGLFFQSFDWTRWSSVELMTPLSLFLFWFEDWFSLRLWCFIINCKSFFDIDSFDYSMVPRCSRLCSFDPKINLFHYRSMFMQKYPQIEN